MPPNAPVYYPEAPPGAPRTAVTRKPNAFARAIDSFLSDVKRNEDVKSPFYKEVLCELGKIALQDDSAQQNQRAAQTLSVFIQEMDSRKRRDSKVMRFGEKLRPLVTGLAQFTSAADIAIQAGPSAAIVLYSGARLIIQLAQNFHRCFDRVLDILAEVGILLRCYGLFSMAYEASEDMQELLVESYKNIVVFWQRAAKLLSRKSYKIVSTGLLKPLDAEWQKCHEGLYRDCNRVRALAHATEAELQKQRDLKDGRLRQREQRKQVVEWLKAGEDDTTLDVRVDLQKYLESHHAHTGEWLYEDPTFVDWLDENSSMRLWYHAGPGSGKTVMASTLIRHLQARGLKVAYFFFSFSDSKRRKSITGMRSLALQILSQTLEIPDQVMKLYEADVANHVFTLSNPRTAVLVLQAFLKLPDRIHIILDGLDECQDGQLMRSSFSHFMSTHTYGIVKWFFTSRNENEIRIMARQVQATEIEPSPSLVISDIKRYLEEKTTRDDLPECCVESWADASEANFLWISLMLDIMVGEDLTCEEEIAEELEKFPMGLTGCYLRSLEQLLLRSKQQQELARKIFALLVVAEQPLHLSELSNALGIREGAEDYSAQRVPKADLIEDLCAHLVRFDRTFSGSEKDPLLKLAHKSVQDFFNQDPDSLELPVPVGLRPFFVIQEVANLEIGKACLTYLNYKRYQEPPRDFTLLSEDEHAFLKYAVTFWFRHLMRTKHSLELFSINEQFIRSPNFWTCLMVQCKIAPHLFAQLMEVQSGQYSLDVGRALRPTAPGEQSLNYAFPLPDWLDEYHPYGPILAEEFFTFVKEWHAVLTSNPLALTQCVRDFTGSTYPCRNPSQSKDIEVLRLSKSDAEQQKSKVMMRDLRVHDSDLQVTLTREEHGEQSHLIAQEVRINNAFASTESSREVVLEKQFTTYPNTCDLQLVTKGDKGELSLWTLQLDSLNLILDDGSQSKQYRAKEEIEGSRRLSSDDESVPWLKRSLSSMNKGNSVYGFHCFKTTQAKELETEEDSGYGTSSSNSHSEDDSEGENESSTEGSLNSHCLVLVSHGRSPVWVAWQSDSRVEMQIEFAAHPTEPIAVWSHSAFELQISDLRTGNIRSVILPEPVDIQIRAAAAVRKEMHFSPDGKTLYYLVASFTNNKLGTLCAISVSSFHFPSSVDELQDLNRSGLKQHITYQVSKSVKEISPTFMLTHWTADHLYIALPLFSSSPKIVRLALAPTGSASPSSGFKTLQNPLYFPTSTPYRNPRLYSHSSKSTNATHLPQHLILALDPDQSDQKQTSAMASPVLIFWSIFGTNNWRHWVREEDELSAELKAGHHTYEMLRGTFVDSEQRFSIPIRSGLDWTKKAFVSCA